MLEFTTTRPKGNPSMPDGVTAPTLDCEPYRIAPFQAAGGIGWTLFGPGLCETFKGGPAELRLADAIRRADCVASVDRAIECRNLGDFDDA